MPQPLDRDSAVNGHREGAEDLAAGGPGRGGADQQAGVGVDDELDQAVVACLVDPASCRGRHLCQAGSDR